MSTLTASAGFTLDTIQELLHRGIDGYGLSNLGRSHREASQDLTYGEVTAQSMWQLLSKAGAKQGDTFYDLGGGTGKAVLYASILFPFSRTVGIELLPELYLASQEAVRRYQEDMLPYFPHKQDQRIEMIHGDFLHQDFRDADILFTHCTCFSPEILASIGARCEFMKPGSRVITVSRELPSTAFRLMMIEPCRLGWGDATAYIYERF